MESKLKNKIALITGGSRGIGRAIALAFGREGAKVAVCYNTSKEKAEEAVSIIKSFGSEAVAYQMTLTDRSAIKFAIGKIQTDFGSIEILVNNAGIAQEKTFGTITDEDWDTMLSVNLKGPFISIQEAIPSMVKKRWGRIINIVSIGGQWGGLNQVHYAAAKAGLINLTRSIAKIYSKYGITSNAVSPGLVNTAMVRNELSTEAGKEKIRNIPIGRIATPEEIANVVVFLASEEASYITGQTVNVNGGMYFG
jgi:NAD(P)-dependent dehydrogenase (short-subunit alcohol dehydrogenase family)